MESLEQKTARNRRVQARYDELMREGKRGHYETMFRVVREEVEAERERWQPIETAPCNTLVIVFVKNCGVTLGSKHEGIGWAWDVLDDEPEDSEATHWMPLPSPPATPTTAQAT